MGTIVMDQTLISATKNQNYHCYRHAATIPKSHLPKSCTQIHTSSQELKVRVLNEPKQTVEPDSIFSDRALFNFPSYY